MTDAQFAELIEKLGVLSRALVFCETFLALILFILLFKKRS